MNEHIMFIHNTGIIYWQRGGIKRLMPSGGWQKVKPLVRGSMEVLS